jgi:integrase
MLLTAKAVAGLELPAGKNDAIHFDNDLAGFGYRLRRDSGNKIRRSWIAQYRRAGRTRRVLLGSASVLGADVARAAAKKVLAAVALGEDPQADRADRRDKDRLSASGVIAEYIEAKRAQVRANTFTGLQRYLTGPYFKPLHALPIDTVSRKDIAACLVRIARTNGAATAGRARSVLHAFIVWCMQMGYVEHNPVIGTAKARSAGARDRVLNGTELAAVWRACGDDDHGRVVRLLILTGCRRQEVGGLRWSELDAKRGIWALPKQRAKNARAHVLPLPAVAWNIINAVPKIAVRDQLFGVNAEDGFTAWATSKTALDRRLGDAVASFTLHDLRRSVATGMADLGVAPHVIEQILNHQSGHKRGVAGIYNRSSYERETRAALALWADHVHTLVEGGERKVIAFQQVSTEGS